MIVFESHGNFERTEKFLKYMAKGDIFRSLDRYGREGAAALARATPADSGLAASSWTYEVRKDGSTWTLAWLNTNIENGFPVAIMIQYGHGTGTGGYVAGRDYINPAIRPIFDRIADEVWREVTSA